MLKRIFVFLISSLVKIFSVFPVLSFTSDEKFGAFELNLKDTVKEQLSKWRISLFQIMLGTSKLYMFTWKREFDDNAQKFRIKFNILKRLSLEKIFDRTEHISKIYDDYYARLSGFETSAGILEKRLSAEKESLCYHIESEKNRIESSDNKIVIYTTVALTVLPIIVGLNFDYIFELFVQNWVFTILFCVAIYAIFNVFLYFYQYIKVGSYSMSSFSDLKDTITGQLDSKITAQYYFDYQSLTSKADLFVSYVKNIQYWMIGLLIVFIVIFSYHKFITYDSSNRIISNNSNCIISNIEVDKLTDPYSQSSIKLTDIKRTVQKKEADKLIIIINGKTDYEIIKKELLLFEDSFEIQYVTDNELEVDNAKIVIYKGESVR